MENKINVAELLKDCPKGMELYSPIFGNVYLEKIRPYLAVVVSTSNKQKEEFLYDGRFGINGECMLFPSKENRDWSTFQRPFKDGDVVATLKGNQIFIFKENVVNIDNSFSGVCYCGYDIQENKLFKELRLLFSRFATEEEKQKLFDAIKANGYKWNADTKTLEDLIVPKFKVGDRVKHKDGYFSGVVTKIYNGCYKIEYDDETVVVINIKEQDEWELVPNKFDINTLKAFESRVLVRTSNHKKWVAAFYSHYDKDALLHHCVVGGLWYEQCIPYEGNEHLLDTTNECNEYYKTWKK